ncbi:MAG: hypothetical protein J1E36_03145 [Eubacterium sp.]|nr:hypothetical protein [Eubacterium sp.]
MKKLLSIILAICVMLTASITAFAAEKPTSEKVMKQIEGAVAYLTNGVDSYGVDGAVDFSIIADSGADVSKFADAFLADVKANLDANGGKIVSSYGENITTYAAVITALLNLGEDPEDFNGYDITKAFLAMDPTDDSVAPSYYRIITGALIYCDDSDEFLEAVCDTYISTYYTMGKGVDYYGYSCDNTAYFIDAIANGYFLLDKYKDVLDDAMKVLETYKVNGGYCFNPEYGTAPNADSTALALMAHSAYTDDLDDLDSYFDIVNGIYADLCTFEGSTTGVFTYDGDESAYTTKEALIALSYYYFDALLQEVLEELPEEEEPTTEVTEKAETTTVKETTTKTNTSKKSPATGVDVTAVSASVALFAAAGVLAVLKKKEK